METILSKNGSLLSYESLDVGPERAASFFNQGIKKEENRISSQAISDISRDTYFRINVSLVAQHRKVDVSTRKVIPDESFPKSITVVDPWEVDIDTDLSYKNSTQTFVVNESQKIVTCDACAGQGKNECRTCNGQGLVLCPTCKGVNSTVETSTAKRRGVVTRGLVGAVVAGPIGMVLGGATARKKIVTSSQVCRTCFGKGTLTCRKCHGEGIQTCEDCDGVGRVVEYQEITAKNTFTKKDIEINRFNSNLARKQQPNSQFQLELLASRLDETVLSDIPKSELVKLKDPLVDLIQSDAGQVLKFKIDVASLPVFRVHYSAQAKQREFKLVGSDLKVEKRFFEKLLDFPLFPVTLYSRWSALPLITKILLLTLGVIIIAGALYLVVQ